MKRYIMQKLVSAPKHSCHTWVLLSMYLLTVGLHIPAASNTFIDIVTQEHLTKRSNLQRPSLDYSHSMVPGGFDVMS